MRKSRTNLWIGLALLTIPAIGCASSTSEILALHAADDPYSIVARQSAYTPDGSLASFVVGKALYALERLAQARPHLEAAARRNQAWTDEAHWLAYEIARRQKRTSAAVSHLSAIIQRESGSSWYPRALAAHCDLQASQAAPLETKLLLKAADQTSIADSSRGKYLLLAARQSSPAIARDLLVRGLTLELYDKNGAALTRELLLLAVRIRLKPIENIELAAGQVRINQERAALARLSRLTLHQLDTKSQIRLLSVQCWIHRRMRNWAAAEASVNAIAGIASPEAAFTALEQGFRLAQGQGSLSGMQTQARRMVKLDRSAALYWWKVLIGKAKTWTDRITLACELLDTWPGESSAERLAVDSLIQLYLSKNFGEFERLARHALPRIEEPWRKAAILYHLHITAQGQPVSAASVVLAEPLGYYHRLLENTVDDGAALKALEIGTNWQAMATASFTASPPVKARIFAQMKRGKNRLPNPEILLISDSLDSDKLAALLTPSARPIFRALVSAGLWSEALDEILRRHPPGGSNLTGQPAGVLIQIARLAARAARSNVEIWCTWSAVRKCGWQYQLAAVEKAIGGTVCTRIFPRHYNREVLRWSKHNRLDPLLVHALIRQESAYNRSIASWAGAVGLMQLMPSTAAGIASGLGLARYDLKHADTNIRFGCNMLRWLRDTFGNNEADILIGYNSGPGNIARWKNAYRTRWGLEPTLARYTETIPYDETKNYIKLVLSNLSIYRYLYQ